MAILSNVAKKIVTVGLGNAETIETTLPMKQVLTYTAITAVVSTVVSKIVDRVAASIANKRQGLPDTKNPVTVVNDAQMTVELSRDFAIKLGNEAREANSREKESATEKDE